jgi:hypothetical protein
MEVSLVYKPNTLSRNLPEEDSECSDRYLNQKPLEYNSEALSLELPRSVMMSRKLELNLFFFLLAYPQM